MVEGVDGSMRRDNVIKKVRNYVKDNNIGGVSVDGWMGGYEVVVFFNRGDEVKDYKFIID